MRGSLSSIWCSCRLSAQSQNQRTPDELQVGDRTAGTCGTSLATHRQTCDNTAFFDLPTKRFTFRFTLIIGA